MDKFNLQIDTSNASFKDHPEDEIAIVLQGLVNAIHSNLGVEHTLLDSNGNTVGKSYYD